MLNFTVISFSIFTLMLTNSSNIFRIKSRFISLSNISIFFYILCSFRCFWMSAYAKNLGTSWETHMIEYFFPLRYINLYVLCHMTVVTNHSTVCTIIIRRYDKTVCLNVFCSNIFMIWPWFVIQCIQSIHLSFIEYLKLVWCRRLQPG